MFFCFFREQVSLEPNTVRVKQNRLGRGLENLWLSPLSMNPKLCACFFLEILVPPIPNSPY